jgi:hypothetical protein
MLCEDAGLSRRSGGAARGDRQSPLIRASSSMKAFTAPRPSAAAKSMRPDSQLRSDPACGAGGKTGSSASLRGDCFAHRQEGTVPRPARTRTFDSRKLLPLSVLALVPAGLALAQPPLANCGNTAEMDVCRPGPKSVVVIGSPALEPLFDKLGTALAAPAAGGLDVYYVRHIGACQGAQWVQSGASFQAVADHITTDALSRKTSCCDFNFVGKADLWVSEMAGAECFDGKLPAEFRDFSGPILAYDVVVPFESPQFAITAEEAYFVFGFGSGGYKGQAVAPWTDDKHFAVPGPEYGIQAIWAKFLRLPPPAKVGTTPGVRIKGVPTGADERVIPYIALPEERQPGSIGLTSTQIYETSLNRRDVRPLAVQAWNQKRAFYPDSTSRAFDKRNVRDGRYPFWAPIHMIAKADITGRVLNDKVEFIIGYLQGKKDLAGVDIVAATVGAHLVPTCAMKVTRPPEKPETGDLMPYAPSPGTACGCMMDELVSRGSSGCTACSKDEDCTGGKSCGHGYCE